MAVPDVTLSTVGADEDTGSITIHKKKRRRVIVRRASRLRGAERLFEEADKLVDANAKSWAQLFNKAAQDGDRASVKTLVGFARLKKPRAEPVKKPRRGMTLGQRLEKDLLEHGEWTREVEKESREVGEEQGIGIRE